MNAEGIDQNSVVVQKVTIFENSSRSRVGQSKNSFQSPRRKETSSPRIKLASHRTKAEVVEVDPLKRKDSLKQMIELFMEDGVLGVPEDDPETTKHIEDKDEVRTPKSQNSSHSYRHRRSPSQEVKTDNEASLQERELKNKIDTFKNHLNLLKK